MQIEEVLIQIKKETDNNLERFFENKKNQLKQKEGFADVLEMTEYLQKYVLNYGKRIRPILFCCGYVVYGGEKKKEILEAAISVELIHSYLLIHDDIIDRDDFRHKDLSMHKRYEKKFDEDPSIKAPEHYGTSMAIIAGDLASSFGYEALTNCDFPVELKLKAIQKMNQIIEDTISGEAMDVELCIKKDFKPEDITEMQIYKTAKYTMEGPLHLGAILAGAGENCLRLLSKFAIPLGIAFQLQDDIIGIFGDERATGKPVGADIREGKMTLLTARAIENADEEQKKFLNCILGKKDATIGEIGRVKEIIISTGSLEFSQQKIDALIEQAKQIIDKMKIKEVHKQFLRDLGDFMARRKY